MGNGKRTPYKTPEIGNPVKLELARIEDLFSLVLVRSGHNNEKKRYTYVGSTLFIYPAITFSATWLIYPLRSDI